MPKGLRILVVGASGFIGHACMQQLSALGNDVVGIGRRTIPNSHLKYYHLISFEAESLRSIVADFTPDWCLNAAGSGNPSASVTVPTVDFEANTVIVQRILEALRLQAPHCRYIGISSAAVYGNNPELPWIEDALPNPRSPYGYHKLCAELLAREYHQLYGLPTLTLRLFSVYGPGLCKQLFWDIFQRSKRTNELLLFGTGHETRDYIYIDDVASGVAMLIQQAQCAGEILNLGSGRATSISEASNIFLRELGWKGMCKFTDKEIAGSPLHMVADMTRTFAKGFRAKVELKEGLSRTAVWLNKIQNNVS
jgi:UDP-glucose 4-epimerase